MGPTPTSLRATWVTMAPLPSNASPPTATWWPAAGGANASSAATARTYSAGVLGWHGAIYEAVMAPLQEGVVYAYSVSGGGSASPPLTFSLPPPAGAASTRLAFMGDVGTIVPLGWAVCDRLAEEHLEGAAGRFDAVIVAGDLSYSTVEPSSCSPTNPGCDSVEWTWDSWGMQVEPFAATAPLLTAVGNHEKVPGNVTALGPAAAPTLSAFAAYEARYPTRQAPAQGMSFWYSVDVGPIHLVFLSSEHPFAEDSAQGAWLARDLAAVNRASTPWVAAVLHRPVYSAAVLEWADHSPGGKLSAALEPPFQRGGVDLCLAGHIHSWDYTHAVRNGSVVARPANGTSTYADPGAPIYVVQGTGGGLPENVFFDPPPPWSAARILGSFGYGRITASAKSLQYEFVGLYGEVLGAFQITKS